MELSIEVTDTFGGEANYSWVTRVSLTVSSDVSDLATIRRIKKAIGWNGIRCQVVDFGDSMEIRPSGICQVCFVNFEYE